MKKKPIAEVRADNDKLRDKNKALRADLKQLRDHPAEIAKEGSLIGLMGVRKTEARSRIKTFPYVPTFGMCGIERDLKALINGRGDWTGHYIMTDGLTVWLEPYE